MPKLTLNIEDLTVDSFSTGYEGDPVPMAPIDPNLSLGVTECFHTCAGTCAYSVCYTCNTCQSCNPTCRLGSDPCELTV